MCYYDLENNNNQQQHQQQEEEKETELSDLREQSLYALESINILRQSILQLLSRFELDVTSQNDLAHLALLVEGIAPRIELTSSVVATSTTPRQQQQTHTPSSSPTKIKLLLQQLSLLRNSESFFEQQVSVDEWNENWNEIVSKFYLDMRLKNESQIDKMEKIRTEIEQRITELATKSSQQETALEGANEKNIRLEEIVSNLEESLVQERNENEKMRQQEEKPHQAESSTSPIRENNNNESASTTDATVNTSPKTVTTASTTTILSSPSSYNTSSDQASSPIITNNNQQRQHSVDAMTSPNNNNNNVPSLSSGILSSPSPSNGNNNINQMQQQQMNKFLKNIKNIDQIISLVSQLVTSKERFQEQNVEEREHTMIRGNQSSHSAINPLD